MSPADATTAAQGIWVSPPADHDPDLRSWFQAARQLSLSYVPQTAAAAGLVEGIVAQVLDYEARTSPRRRGAGLRAKLHRATGAIVGGVLHLWSRPSACFGFQSLHAKAFGGAAVGRNPFKHVTAAMAGLGLIHTARGYKEAVQWDGAVTSRYGGRAARFWPTPGLLELAARLGVTPASVPTDFISGQSFRPTEAPACLVEVRPLVVRHRSDGLPSLPTTLNISDDLFRGLEDGVRTMNECATAHAVLGCRPPQWKRIFHASPLLYGRWHPVGGADTYQSMTGCDRAPKITIDGEEVAEVDIQGSHLSVMHGLLGLPVPDDDPYLIPGVPRPFVKDWVVATLGSGKRIRQWPVSIARKRTDGTRTAMKAFGVSRVGDAVCARYPFMEAPAQAVAQVAGLTALASLGTPERLLALRLQNIEAAAVTEAMLGLCRSNSAPGGILALPVHDSLIVPKRHVDEAGELLKAAFVRQTGAMIRVAVKRHANSCSSWPLGALEAHRHSPLG